MKKYLFLILLITFIFLTTENVKAGIGDNISGYAWSENIGWISFNCTNDGSGISCEESRYGVNIDQNTGDFSGYAWSENIGWISFNKEDVARVCCLDECGANYSFDTQEVTGFARVVSAGGGWDGCLKLRGEWGPGREYGLSINPEGKFSGWAWSDDVLGWVSFSHLNCDSEPDGISDGRNYSRCPEKQDVSEYQVIFSFEFNNAPEARMDCSVVECGGLGCVCPGDPWETYNRGRDSSNAIFEILNESTDPDPGDSIAFSDWKLVRVSDGSTVFHMTCSEACNYTIQDHDSGDYRVELEVFDQKRKPSDLAWHLLRIKQEAIAGFDCSLFYSEEPSDWKSCDDNEFKNQKVDTVIYLKDTSLPSEGATEILQRIWTLNGSPEFNIPTTSITLKSGSNSIKIEIKDDMERTDSLSESIMVDVPAPPKWKEVSPISFKEKILSFFHKFLRA